jgi:endonuclease/exonuclease/phosphatase family metal-dependent hydrolase
MKSACFVLALTLPFLIAASASAGERLRIATFNAELLAAPGTNASRLQRYRWDAGRREHFERVASIIETLDPDILNLVEVTSVEGVEYLVKILREKGLTDYRGYHVESNDHYTGMDVALISKFPPTPVEGQAIRLLESPKGDMTWRAEFSFVDDETGEHRTRVAGLDRHAVYLIEARGRKLGFLGLHLKANPDDAYSNAKREAESEIARRIVRREIVARGYTPIVLGDLNDYDADVPDRDDNRGTATRVLTSLKDYDPARPGRELVNVARRVVRRADRYTSHWDRNENGAADPYDVRTMLDHILLHESLMPSVRRVFISHASDMSVSDHWPVVVDLEFDDEE